MDLAREAKDPQTLTPALSFGALASLEAGNRVDAERLADELLADETVNRPIPHHIAPLFDLAWVLADLDRSEELAAKLEQATVRTLYVEAAESLAHGDYERAADMYGNMGARPNEAYTRLRAGAALMHAGRSVDAQSHVSAALEFWRGVGAARYMRQAEAVASSFSEELPRQDVGP